MPGNSNLARSWAKCARAWPRGEQRHLLDLYPRLEMPVLLLWADDDPMYPLSIAEEALAMLPNGQLRVLGSTGFLLAYDDPGGLAAGARSRRALGDRQPLAGARRFRRDPAADNRSVRRAPR